ncbi:MAG: hypothetical protein ACRDPY_39740 [Streptosporangiaceae bacterium]
MTDNRMAWGLIRDVLDVLERHGYRQRDTQHTGQPAGAIGDLSHIYEGSQDRSVGPSIYEIPSSQTEPAPPGQGGQADVAVPASEVKTLLAALDIAADYKRDRAETCADCADKSCLTCQSRLQDAQAYDRLAAQLVHTAEASTAITPSHSGSADQPSRVADREAGQ